MKIQIPKEHEMKKPSDNELAEKYTDPFIFTKPEDVEAFLGRLNDTILVFGREDERGSYIYPQFRPLDDLKVRKITRIEIYKDRNKVLYYRWSDYSEHLFHVYTTDYDYTSSGIITSRVDEVLKRVIDKMDHAIDLIMVEMGQIETQRDNLYKYWK